MPGLGLVKQIIPLPLVRRLADARAYFNYPTLSHGPGCLIPSSCSVEGTVTLGRKVALGPAITLRHSTVGDYWYLGSRCLVAHAEIGKYCSIAPDVVVGLGSHPLAPFVSTHPAFYLRCEQFGWGLADRDYRSPYKPTKVGNDVWIGLRAAIRDGVTIGHGAVIGAGAVVIADVPPYAIVAGVPARLIRYRFAPELVRLLLDLRWWDKNEDWLRANWRKFHDITQLVTAQAGGHGAACSVADVGKSTAISQ